MFSLIMLRRLSNVNELINPTDMGVVWFQFMGGGVKQRMIQLMGGEGAKQWMIKYRLCRHYDWTQKTGYSNIETFPCMEGLTSTPSS